MNLNEITKLLTIKEVHGDTDIEFFGIKMNSTRVVPGDLFICVPGIPGLLEDRHQYAEDAIRAGAVALVVEQDVNINVPTIKVPDSRYAMAVISTHFNGYSSSKIKVVGVTGTNGKTTTSHMLESILSHSGFKTGMMGNLGTKIGSTLFETDLNTQEAPTLQLNLKRMVDESIDYCVMEVSSQGLSLDRVLGCDFRTGIFTNLTQDHLDYHHSMDLYQEAKGLLFSRMGNSFHPDPSKRKFAILNADDPVSEAYKKLTSAQVITYGIINDADIMAKNIALNSTGTNFDLISYKGDFPVSMKMVGTFNVYNALAAIAAALVEDIPTESIQLGLKKLKMVRGRMEIIDAKQDFLLLVDYAHTPDGLDKALSTLNEFAEKRIITVFGCGGDRDRTKRPIMGRIAAEYSDVVIVTSDNPRSEDPIGILKDIEKGIKEKSDSLLYELQVDRKLAIKRAVELAQEGDIIIIAGKGHETYQIINRTTFHFDDADVAREALREK